MAIFNSYATNFQMVIAIIRISINPVAENPNLVVISSGFLWALRTQRRRAVSAWRPLNLRPLLKRSPAKQRTAFAT